MKTVQNLPTGIDSKKVITYGNLCTSVVKSPVEKGFDIELMRRTLKILNVIEAAGDEALTFEFEDAEFEHLKQVVNSFRWGIAHKDIVAFVDHINSIE